MNNNFSFNSKFGWLSVYEENKKIVSISFSKTKSTGNSESLKKFKANIDNFFKKKTNQFNVSIKLKGNKLQKKIWQEIKKIKYGKTKSYNEIAKKLNISPRYVGKVCGQNKHLLVIPCHRVVRSDGSLGGFSARGGIQLKQQLLNFERE